MGDRANIVIRERQGGYLYFYTHNRGWELPLILQRALGRQQRWEDGAYLARIIFCGMVEDDVTGSLNYGISTCLGDNQYPLLVVDMITQTVGLAPEPSPHTAAPVVEKSWSFAQYIRIELPLKPWQALQSGEVRIAPETRYEALGEEGVMVMPYEFLAEFFDSPKRRPKIQRRRPERCFSG